MDQIVGDLVTLPICTEGCLTHYLVCWRHYWACTPQVVPLQDVVLEWFQGREIRWTSPRQVAKYSTPIMQMQQDRIQSFEKFPCPVNDLIRGWKVGTEETACARRFCGSTTRNDLFSLLFSLAFS